MHPPKNAIEMQANLLILHPSDPNAVPEETELLDPLRDIGFIAGAMDFEGTRHYRPGEDFLQLVTFLGCSPVVSLGEPGKTGEEFCHIGFSGPMPRPVLIAGANAKAPRCPSCRKPDDQWRQGLEAGAPVVQSLTCPHCGNCTPLQAWNWRQCAGFARVFVAVWGIFEGEAVPSDELMRTLERTGHGPWSHFYFRGEAPVL